MPSDRLMRPDRHQPLRIFEIETFGRGGLTHYTYNLSNALAERGHRVTFVTAAGYELEDRSSDSAEVDSAEVAVKVLQAIGRTSHRLGTPRGIPRIAMGLLRKLEAIRDAYRVAALARRHSPDVVHLHCTNPAVLVYLQALRRVGCTVVATTHVVTPHEPIRLQQSVYRRVHRLPDALIAHSEFDRQRLIQEFAVDPGKVEVIPHGEYGFFERGGVATDRATARQELGLDPAAPVALFFGYIREYKGLDILLSAWPAVRQALPDARLVIAGDPVNLADERRQELEAWATREGAVHHFGYVPFDDVGRYFTAADTLVMPYRHISQSGVLYLALSLGLPVVATKVGALTEMLTDGDSALMVPPEDPDTLAAALTRLLADDTLRRQLAEGGRRLAEEHSWPSIAEQTEGLFRRLVGADSSS